MSDDKFEMPAIINHWLKEMNNSRNSQFQRDLYRQKCERLIEKLQAELHGYPRGFTDNVKKTTHRR